MSLSARSGHHDLPQTDLLDTRLAKEGKTEVLSSAETQAIKSRTEREL